MRHTEGREDETDPRLLDAAIQLFGNKGPAVTWLYQPVRALGYKRPVDVDIEEALDLIGRLEQGVGT
jgi:putative toxin-antitoxin system antitoxin component (TIGR02293 family)